MSNRLWNNLKRHLQLQRTRQADRAIESAIEEDLTTVESLEVRLQQLDSDIDAMNKDCDQSDEVFNAALAKFGQTSHVTKKEDTERREKRMLERRAARHWK